MLAYGVAARTSALSTADRCRVVLAVAAVCFITFGFTFRTLGFHLRPSDVADGLVSNDIFVEVFLSRALLRGDLRGIYEATYEHAGFQGGGPAFAGVPLTALPVLPVVAVCDRLGASKTTVWALAGLPFVLCGPLAAWALWRAGGAGPQAPDVALVAVALLCAPYTFNLSIFHARPALLFPLLDLAAILALRRSVVRSGLWMALAIAAKPTSLITAVCLAIVLGAHGLRERQLRPAAVWCGVCGGVLAVVYGALTLAAGPRVLTNLGAFVQTLMITTGSVPWLVLRGLGAAQVSHPLYQWVHLHWTASVLILLQGIVCVVLVARRPLRPDAPYVLALVAAGHAFVVALGKTAFLRYAAYPDLLVLAWAVQPSTPHGIRWAFAVLIGQTFIVTAVPVEWRTPVWCIAHAALALVLWRVVGRTAPRVAAAAPVC